MKLTEQQLAHIFQDSTCGMQSATDVADALARPKETEAESIVSDFSTAQATRQVIQLKAWSEDVAKDIQKSQNNSGFSRFKSLLSNWLPNAPLATTALAVVFALSAVVFMSEPPTTAPMGHSDMVTEDVINSIPFEGNNDRLSRGGFDGDTQTDKLFNANFG